MTREELPDLLPGLQAQAHFPVSALLHPAGVKQSMFVPFHSIPEFCLWKFMGSASLAVSLSSLPHRNLLTREKHVRIQPVVEG